MVHINTIDIIYKFLDEQDYLNRKEILGIIFYGSSNYKTDTKCSDIDLLIITNDENNYKGVTYVDNKKIEYFEKNVYDLAQKIEELPSNFDRSLESIFTNGKVIYDKHKTIENLKDLVLENNEYPRKKKQNKFYSTSFSELKKTFFSTDKTSPYFNYIYYNFLEEIRKEYHIQNGYSKLPVNKIKKLYENSDYSEKYYCVKLPDIEFRNLYISLLEKYKEDEFNVLLGKLKRKQTIKNNFNARKNNVKYSSTIIYSLIEKIIVKDTNEKDYLSLYYIALEKIRNLYCNINKLDNSLDNIYEYDSSFFEIFNDCVSNPSKENITLLFNYLSSKIDIDYTKYKIYELS
ncbi:MAG: nucleotidyltransferase domain-containing protein [Mollicutes bacterium]|nr:nucleotidyltransferase domain-containing protein [Mollicutes bacterium]